MRRLLVVALLLLCLPMVGEGQSIRQYPPADGVVRVFNYSIPDNGNGGTAATYTLQMARYSLVTLTCADAQGCNVTMGETGIAAGTSVTIIQIAAGAGNVTIMDDNGVTAEVAGGGNWTMGVLDSITLQYLPVGYWIQTAYIDMI